MKIVAHRYGNNLSLLEKALANNSVDEIECDLRFENNKLVVRHNRRFRFFPFTVERWQRGIVFRNQIRELSLKEVIARLEKTEKKLTLDLKVQRIEQADPFLSALLGVLFENRERARSFSVHCKNLVILQKLQLKMREGRIEGVELFHSIANGKELLVNLYKNRLWFLTGVSCKKGLLDRVTIKALRYLGLKVYLWTIYSKEELARLSEDRNISGLITDYLPEAGGDK